MRRLDGTDRSCVVEFHESVSFWLMMTVSRRGYYWCGRNLRAKLVDTVINSLSDDARLTSVCLLSVAYLGPKSRTERRRKTKISTEVAHVIRDSGTTFKVKRSRSPGRFTHRRVGTSGSCSGGRGNVLAVRNCCYVAVCSAAQGPSGVTFCRACSSRRSPMRSSSMNWNACLTWWVTWAG